ncbi:MAG: hypothetical protein A2X18_04650 [Bacteroidetes bacterium GWF2_40_14]|nr:MAG: hypothetical protein A2X18_04650 [Bacteroidetes bacterium GWF2_40_14]
MKTATKFFSSISLLITTIFLSSTSSFAQYQNQQEEKPKTPVEIAALQADKYQKDLGLNDGQTFLVDSVLQVNIGGVYSDFERMKKGGVQTQESYRAVQELWMNKTDAAFKKIFTPEQYLKYEKLSGLYAKRIKEEKAKAKLEKEKAKKLDKNKQP